MAIGVKGIPGSVDLLLMTSLRWTFGGSSGTGIGSPTDPVAAPLVHSTYLSTCLLLSFLSLVLQVLNREFIYKCISTNFS